MKPSDVQKNNQRLSNNPYRAVLTGDIVNSSKLNIENRKKLQISFSILSNLLQKTFPEDILYPLTNFRGDSWQAIVSNPINSLKVSLFIRSFFRFQFPREKIDSRIAIGIGIISFIPTENLSAGDGPAYLTSGHLLDSLTNDRLAIGFSEKVEEPSYPALKGLILLLDQFICTWSASQSQAIFWSLQNLRQKEVAEKWIPQLISQAAVSKNLRSANWESIKQSMFYFEKSIMNILIQNENGG